MMKNLMFVSCFFISQLVSATPPTLGGYKVYFGSLHNHTTYSDGQGTPATAYLYAKNTSKQDFLGITDHDAAISETEWLQTKQQADSLNSDGIFTTFYGFEWSAGKFGHVAVLGTSDIAKAKQIPTFEDLKAWLSTRSGVAFCNHPGRQDKAGVEFDHFRGIPSDRFVGIELWNSIRGFSEYYYNDGYFANDSTKGYYDEALAKGWKLGAAGSGDNHKGTWGTSEDSRLAILAKNLTRKDLMEALVARRFYSTLDKNLALSFKIDGQEMGSTLKPGTYTLQIKAKDADGERISEIVLIDKNHQNVKTWNPNSKNVTVSSKINTLDGDYYYIKVKEADGNEAISSPIWIKKD